MVETAIAKDAKIYQFKISLIASHQVIWRRIQVPEDYSFWQLHVAIQDAMGWEDCHLHQFTMYDFNTGFEVEIGSPSLLVNNKMLDEQKVKIAEYFPLANKIAIYEYDFGDGWLHKILLEKILPADKSQQYPIAISGKRKCPPEDSGGIYGYNNLLKIISDPDHSEHEDMIEWIGDKFDPEEFDAKSVIFTHREEES